MATAEAQVFVYKGKDRKGTPVQGEIRSANANFARAQLRKQGITANNVKKKPKPLFGSGGKPIKPADIAAFTRQMATMMKAGVPLVQSFDIVAEGCENTNLKSLIESIRDDVAAGASFGSSLRKHPKYFDDLFCSLVESGETSGALETMLDRIALYKEKLESLKAKVRKAMTYPAAVLAVAIIVMGILLVKVIPQFAKTFSSFGSELPAFTQFVLGISEAAQANWWLWLIVLVGSIFAFKEAKTRSPKFSDTIDKYTLKIPIVGVILNEGAVARFARTLSTTFAAGVPLVDALDSVARASGNAVYRDAIYKVRDDVTTGVQLNSSMKSTGVFPTLLVQMAAIGEESGALDSMLEKAAIHYEEAVDNAVDNLTTLLEPMIMAVIGVLVGGMLIAMYLPIFQIGQAI
ncbi:type II secretion system F family protein [Porticoccus sp. W117]|uniref:type II secretion system F family protein n=1 Tax=Porticoccus sp. W117 TaxID=3054777 RepID=UPI0025981349|nr:type II secretion system F family protein [Porticoccus sp. W117]MDM3872584.1 type II secretion system F family protein [Porticoccus sp. W117]